MDICCKCFSSTSDLVVRNSTLCRKQRQGILCHSWGSLYTEMTHRLVILLHHWYELPLFMAIMDGEKRRKQVMAVIGVMDSSWTRFLASIFHYKHSTVDAQQGSGQTTLRIREYSQLGGIFLPLPGRDPRDHWVPSTSCGWFQRSDPGWELNGKAPGCCKHKGKHCGAGQDLNKWQNPAGERIWFIPVLAADLGRSLKPTHTHLQGTR